MLQEYEAGESAEAKFVKDLDRLDMVLQAFEYEKRDNCPNKHQEFFESTKGKFNHQFVKDMVEEIINQRKTIQASTEAESEDKTLEKCDRAISTNEIGISDVKATSNVS